MKTFRLIALEIIEGNNVIDVPLEDGLIINKEDESSNWLLEAYTDLTFYDYFKTVFEQNRDIIVQAVITKRDNSPAYFQTKVAALNKFERHMSVLLEGRLRRNRRDYSEILLESLIQKGYDGQNLLTEFKDKMKSKPKLKN